MPEYRKKATIQAFQLVRFTDGSDRPEWFKDAIAGEVVEEFIDGHVEISTLEGTMTANPGDWIARGVKGELYPIKDEIFSETYELVQEEPAEEASALAGATCSVN